MSTDGKQGSIPKLPPAAYVALMAGTALMSLLFGALGPVLPLMAADLGKGGVFTAQMMMSTPAMGVIVGGLLSGWLAERLGAKTLLIAMLVGYAIIGSSGLYLTAIPILLASRLLLGVCVAAIGTSINTLIGELFDEKKRARLLGFQGGVAGLTSVAALLSSGMLGQAFGWRAAFAIYLIALPLIFFAMLIPAPQAVMRHDPDRLADPRIKRELIGLWPIWLLIFPAYVALFMNAIQISLLLADGGVTSAAVRGGVISASSIASAISGAAYGALYMRLTTRAITALLLSLMAAGYLLIGSGPGLPFIILGVGLGGLGGGILSPHVAAYLLRRASPAARPRAIGFMLTVLFVGDFLNPILVAPIKSAFGIHGAFLVVSGLLVIAATVAAASGKRKPSLR